MLTYDDLGGDEGEDGSLFTVPYGSGTGGQAAAQTQTKSHQGHRASLPTVEMVRPAQTAEDLLAEETEKKPPRRAEYKEDERRHLMQTEAFRKFLDRAVRITERALSCTDSMDIFVDYTGQVESVDRYVKFKAKHFNLLVIALTLV